jgi:hypothetical protein
MRYAIALAMLVAQVPEPSATVSFEAASVKPNASGERNTSVRRLPRGRFTATNVPAALLVQIAYSCSRLGCRALPPGFAPIASTSSPSSQVIRQRLQPEAQSLTR